MQSLMQPLNSTKFGTFEIKANELLIQWTTLKHFIRPSDYQAQFLLYIQTLRNFTFSTQISTLSEAYDQKSGFKIAKLLILQLTPSRSIFRQWASSFSQSSGKFLVFPKIWRVLTFSAGYHQSRILKITDYRDRIVADFSGDTLPKIKK